MGSEDDCRALLAEEPFWTKNGCKTLVVCVCIQSLEDIIENNDGFAVVDCSGKGLSVMVISNFHIMRYVQRLDLLLVAFVRHSGKHPCFQSSYRVSLAAGLYLPQAGKP